MTSIVLFFWNFGSTAVAIPVPPTGQNVEGCGATSGQNVEGCGATSGQNVEGTY